MQYVRYRLRRFYGTSTFSFLWTDNYFNGENARVFENKIKTSWQNFYFMIQWQHFWWQDRIDGVDYSDKSSFNWISVIRIPDFVTKKDFDWAVKTAAEKKKIDCSSAEFLSIEEGLCVQIMHNGSYDDEPTSVKIMDDFIRSNRYENDMTEKRLHHEIYLSDPRKSSPEKWKTVIRHPIKKA